MRENDRHFDISMFVGAGSNSKKLGAGLRSARV